MSGFYPPPQGGSRDLPPSGSYLGTLRELIDLGTQETNYGDKAQIRLGFELDECNAEGRPYLVSQTYNFSSHPQSNFRAMIEEWVLDPIADFSRYDLTDRIGAVAILGLQRQVAASGREYIKITSVLPPPAGAAVRRKTESPAVVLNLRAFDRDVFENLPDWMKQIIAKSPEYQAATSPRAVTQQQPGALQQRPQEPQSTGATPQSEADLFRSAGSAGTRRYDRDLDDEIPF
jgi:hypothetical protein